MRTSYFHVLLRWRGVMRSLCAAALLSAGAALAAEAVLVHDIAPPHPRYTQLTQMAAEGAGPKS